MAQVRGGVVPSDFDGRDLYWNLRDVIPKSVQLHRPNLKNQGSEIDCCTSMAIATAFEIIDHRDGRSTPLSPLYHYYFSRRDPRYLGPVTIRAALKSATTNGFCRLELHDMPMTVSGALQKPSEEAMNDAKERKLLAYDSNIGTAGYSGLDGVDRVDRWRGALSKDLPVIAGIWTQSSYWKGQGMTTNQTEAHQGAHAVCVVGYDDDQESFIVRDSRGPTFADDGEWVLAYTVVATGRVFESWAIRTLTYDD